MAACATAPSPTPAPATTDPAWNPLRDVIDQSAAVWDAHQPGAFAYTVALAEGPATGSSRYRVSSLEGEVDAQHLDGDDAALTAADLSVTALYERARASLDAGAKVALAVDRTYGMPTTINVDGAGTDLDWSAELTDLVVAGDPASGPLAQNAMGAVVDRWSRRLPDEFEYRWTRYRAKDGPVASTIWNVRSENGRMRSSSEAEAAGAVPPETATPGGTLDLLQREIAGGAWVDVAADSATGRDILVAVDPSGSVAGDAYWIRVDFTDLVAEKSRDAQVAAVRRWTAGAPASYSYTWRFRGDGRDLDYRVRVNGDEVTIRPLDGSPAAEGTWASPRIDDTLAMLGEVLDDGGLVKATYHKRLGYLQKAVIVPHGEAGRDGTITITGFDVP